MHTQTTPAHWPRLRRRWSVPTAIGLALTLGTAFTAVPAVATSATGPDGQNVTVSKSDGLNPSGDTVTVTGSGFDLNTGIYVALCVDNGAGQAPSPCLGGADMEGSGGSSAWISSNPPSYGEGLAEPFEEADGKGSFSVDLSVAAKDEFTDCLDPSVAPNGCVIGTRADHTATGDRSADVRIPVTFADDGGTGGTSGAESGAEAGAGGTSGAESGAEPGADSGADADGGTGDPADAKDLAETGVSQPVTAVVGALAALVAGAALVIARRRTATSS